MSPVSALAATAVAIANATASAVSSASVVPAASGPAFPELQPFFGNNTQWADHTAQDDPSFFRTLNASQHPSIVWVGCSDSRVPPSVITKQAPGTIFTHRNIANQIQADDWSAHAVVEYATAHLNVSHVVVVGHTNCGGCAAAFAAPNPDAPASNTSCPGQHKRSEAQREEPGLEHFLTPLIKLRHTLPEGATVQDLIVANVQNSVDNLVSSKAVQNAWTEGRKLCVHGWLYDIGTGLLNDLSFSKCQ